MLFRLPSSRMNTAKVTVLGLSVCLYKYVPCFLRHRATRQQNNDRVPTGSSLHWLHFKKIIGMVSIVSSFSGRGCSSVVVKCSGWTNILSQDITPFIE